ncbi:hypothetical protein CHARACLAT_031292 [Characodon lateralis]|uniref:Prolactin receptor n=1 Tax=Characodon lateralis TaxID=208331 RepID=A0ABU7F0Z6_9TELE|nr:hypothetical protein [Characodon lateralis]
MVGGSWSAWGEPTHAQGKHTISMQKDPWPGVEPRTFLLQGNSATNCNTLSRRETRLDTSTVSSIEREHEFIGGNSSADDPLQEGVKAKKPGQVQLLGREKTENIKLMSAITAHHT